MDPVRRSSVIRHYIPTTAAALTAAAWIYSGIYLHRGGDPLSPWAASLSAWLVLAVVSLAAMSLILKIQHMRGVRVLCTGIVLSAVVNSRVVLELYARDICAGSLADCLWKPVSFLQEFPMPLYGFVCALPFTLLAAWLHDRSKIAAWLVFIIAWIIGAACAVVA